MQYTRLLFLLLVFSTFAVGVSAKPTPHKKTAAKNLGHVKPTPTAVTPVPIAIWTLDPQFLSQLQPEQKFGPYAMRIPVGFIVRSQLLSSDKIVVTLYQFRGPTRKDGSFTTMGLVTGVASPGNKTGTVEDVLNSNAVLNASPDLVKNGTEYGSLSGLKVVRQYFKFHFDKGSPQLTHGLQYVTSDGTTDAKVFALDKEPYNMETLPLCEAAAHTLRKVN